MSRPHRQHGVVLVVALLIVAVATTVAVAIVFGEQLWLRQTQNLADRAQTRIAQRAALEYIGVRLLRNLKHGDVADIIKQDAEITATRLEAPFKSGKIFMQVTDAQSYFNLNNLFDNNNVWSAPEGTSFTTLLQSVGADHNLSQTLRDWIDSDADTTNYGAEDTEYLSSTPPYRTANQMLATYDELRLVKGFTPDVLEQLRPVAIVLPAREVPINVNTASEQVLQSLFYSQQNAVQAIIDGRPYREKNDIATHLQGAQPSSFAAHDVRSSYFLVELEVHYGGHITRSGALLLRLDGQPIQVLWHHPRYPELPDDEDDTESND